MVGVGGGCGVGGVGGAGDVGVVGIVNVGVAGVVVARGVVGVISVFTPLPSVCIYPPPSYISIECRNRRGEQVVKPGHGKRCQEGCTLFFLLE